MAAGAGAFRVVGSLGAAQPAAKELHNIAMASREIRTPGRIPPGRARDEISALLIFIPDVLAVTECNG
jgi:hypothetical protein